jgi:hypothetical protein
MIALLHYGILSNVGTWHKAVLPAITQATEAVRSLLDLGLVSEAGLQIEKPIGSVHAT